MIKQPCPIHLSSHIWFVWNPNFSQDNYCVDNYYLQLCYLSSNIEKDISSVQFSSVTQSCLTLCNPVNHSTPGLPVHHQLLEFTQTHAYRVGDAIQPSHPLSSPSPPAPNPSQHQGEIYRDIDTYKYTDIYTHKYFWLSKKLIYKSTVRLQ